MTDEIKPEAPYFTDAEREAIDEMLAYVVQPPVRFTPKDFDVLPEEKRPVFIVQTMNDKTESEFYKLYAELPDKADSRAVLNCYLKVGLVGAENWRGPQGQPVEYASGPDGHVSDVFLSSLNIHIKTAIKKKILGGNA
jgi:hypothetical protein